MSAASPPSPKKRAQKRIRRIQSRFDGQTRQDDSSNDLFLAVVLFAPSNIFSQERRKIRISYATLSYSALPLVAAREWKLFQDGERVGYKVKTAPNPSYGAEEGAGKEHELARLI